MPSFASDAGRHQELNSRPWRTAFWVVFRDEYLIRCWLLGEFEFEAKVETAVLAG
jgi:hypothetical protein